ncbi:MAG: rhamnogalacturonan acetylesterase [Chitinophagaceae bacterium]
MNKRFAALLLLLLSTTMAFTLQKPKMKIYLVGDSTMSIKAVSAYPETGWGMPFTAFFDSTVQVVNTAQNGRSTRSFIEEKRWQQIMDNLAAGDYVYVQFGHNDEIKEKKTYTTPDEFKTNLRRYVSDTRSKGAFPVLITPVARRRFDANGQIVDTHVPYASYVMEIAKETNTPLIDLNKTSMALLQSFGVENSKLLFNHLQPGEHPNYPKGKEDDTHFNELGARKMAQLVLQEIKTLNLPVADKIVKQ